MFLRNPSLLQKHVREVLKALLKAGFYAKLSQCPFSVTRFTFLGFCNDLVTGLSHVTNSGPVASTQYHHRAFHLRLYPVTLGTTFPWGLVPPTYLLHLGLVLPTLVLCLDLARSAIPSGLQSDLQKTELTSEGLGPSGVSYHPSPPRSMLSHKKTLSLNAFPRDAIAQYHLFRSSRTSSQLRLRW